MNRTTYGLDVAKRVFQMHWVDADTGEIVNRRFSRTELIEFLLRLDEAVLGEFHQGPQAEPASKAE